MKLRYTCNSLYNLELDLAQQYPSAKLKLKMQEPRTTTFIKVLYSIYDLVANM